MSPSRGGAGGGRKALTNALNDLNEIDETDKTDETDPLPITFQRIFTYMLKTKYYGEFGGSFIPEILISTFDQLIRAFNEAKEDPSFWQEYTELMSTYSCRPTPLTFADNLTSHFKGPRFYIKREDLNHTGAHQANNVMGQGLLVKRMGKTRVIAETGAGQHGVATATMAARFGFRCH